MGLAGASLIAQQQAIPRSSTLYDPPPHGGPIIEKPEGRSPAQAPKHTCSRRGFCLPLALTVAGRRDMSRGVYRFRVDHAPLGEWLDSDAEGWPRETGFASTSRRRANPGPAKTTSIEIRAADLREPDLNKAASGRACPQRFRAD